MGRRLLALVVLAGMCIIVAHEDASARQQECGMPIACSFSGGVGCNPAPTSLQAIHPWPDGLFEVPTEGNCGYESCWIVFYCACGSGLSGSACWLETE